MRARPSRELVAEVLERPSGALKVRKTLDGSLIVSGALHLQPE